MQGALDEQETRVAMKIITFGTSDKMNNLEQINEMCQTPNESISFCCF
jgi:hypothetical protein